MKIIAVNGSPRKEWNTAALLRSVLEGAASKGAETELVHLYDLDYKGCVSCFSCKRKGGKSRGRCAVSDGLKPLLDGIETADALVLGSPIYLGSVTGEMRSFFERLTFQYLEYDREHSSLFKRKISTGWITTMNIPGDRLDKTGYTATLLAQETLMARVFGRCESLVVADTLQFNDYSQYEASLFDGDEKKRRHDTVFPEECKKAFDMGARFVS